MSAPGDTNAVRDGFTAFLEADEVDAVIGAFNKLKALLPPDGEQSGPRDGEECLLFDRFERLLTPMLNFKQKKLFQVLSDTRKKQEAMCQKLRVVGGLATEKRPHGSSLNHVVVSGAGPCGLRAAVEAAILGFDVTCVEKRKTFSRANILILWKVTLDDMVSLGAKQYLPELKTAGNMYHMGTRDIQLTLLKSGLLFGVRFHYGTCLKGLYLERTCGEKNA